MQEPCLPDLVFGFAFPVRISQAMQTDGNLQIDREM